MASPLLIRSLTTGDTNLDACLGIPEPEGATLVPADFKSAEELYFWCDQRSRNIQEKAW